MDASAGLTKNSKVPAPPPMPKPGLTLSRDAASLGLGPPRRNPDPWTRPPDDIASGDAMVSARNRFLFTPLPSPMLSAKGARAGLGPEGATGADKPRTGGVDTRPDPRLDRPIASRLPDDISEAAQMAHARAMGVHVPVEAPALSARGAMAGLGTFGPSSSNPKAVGAAAANDLAMSRAKVGMAGRKTTAMRSAPVPAISDASGRRGITGKGVIRAAGAGFEMRVPKGPVAQDRERWKSGTTDRIAAASKGLNLANMDWGDHRGAPPKPQAKRTWVGKQGDATECPDNYMEACADLAVAPHSAVNKAAPFRELEKERVVSDVCPPIRSSAGTLEVMLARDAHLLRTAPNELLRTWASRPSLLRTSGGASAMRTMSLKPSATAMMGLSAGSKKGASCACNDCGCSGKPMARTAISAFAYSGGTPLGSSSTSWMQGGTRRPALTSVANAMDSIGAIRGSSRLQVSSGSMRVSRAFTVQSVSSLGTGVPPPFRLLGEDGLPDSFASEAATPASMKDFVPAALSEQRFLLAPEYRFVDLSLLRVMVRLAAEHSDASAEAVWWTTAVEWPEMSSIPPTAVPDPDLARAIIGIAQRRQDASQPLEILREAMRSPLFVEPALLDLIIKYAQEMNLSPFHDVWVRAWAARVAAGTPLPTPPDQKLFNAIVFVARYGGTAKQILGDAHRIVSPPGLASEAIWPPYIAADLLPWVVFFARADLNTEDAQVLQAALYMVKYSGSPYPPVPSPNADVLHWILKTSRGRGGGDPKDILADALAGLLEYQLNEPEIGQVQEAFHRTVGSATLSCDSAPPINFPSGPVTCTPMRTPSPVPGAVPSGPISGYRCSPAPSAIVSREARLDDRAAAWNAAFLPNGGWMWSDGGHSIPISGGRALWLWGDTFVQGTGALGAIDCLLFRNTLALTGRPPPPPLWFYARAPSVDGQGAVIDISSIDSFPPVAKDQAPSGSWTSTGHELDKQPENRTWLWPVNGVEIEGILYLLYAEIRFPLTDTRKRRFIRVVNPGASPETWSTATSEFIDASGIDWAEFHYDQGTSTVFIFGREPLTGRLHVARTTPAENLMDHETWQFLHRDGSWTGDDTASNLKVLANGVTLEFTLDRLTINGQSRFVLVHTYWDSQRTQEQAELGVLPMFRYGVVRVSDTDSFETFSCNTEDWHMFHLHERIGGWVRGFKAHAGLSELPTLLVGYTNWDDPICPFNCGPPVAPCGSERFAVVDLADLFPK